MIPSRRTNSSVETKSSAGQRSGCSGVGDMKITSSDHQDFTWAVGPMNFDEVACYEPSPRTSPAVAEQAKISSRARLDSDKQRARNGSVVRVCRVRHLPARGLGPRRGAGAECGAVGVRETPQWCPVFAGPPPGVGCQRTPALFEQVGQAFQPCAWSTF